MEDFMDKMSWLTLGVLAVLVLTGISYIVLIGITPTDTKIIDLLDENKQNLLNIVGFAGAGIARDENNYITGIAVYVEGNLTNIQQIPSKLGEFTVYIKDLTETSEFEKERMIIHNEYYNLLDVTTDKTSYQQNDDVTVTIKNESNETFAFGNAVYDMSFERWNGGWGFYTGVIGLEVITYLTPNDTVDVEYKLGGQTDKPFPSGNYRVISIGWLDQNAYTMRVWDYTEFMVE